MEKNKKDTTEKVSLEMFVSRLLEEKKLPEDLEKEVIAQIKTDLLSKVEDRINAVIINNLSGEKLEEFNTMLDKDSSDEETQKFLSETIPNLDQLIATELVVFKQTYLS